MPDTVNKTQQFTKEFIWCKTGWYHLVPFSEPKLLRVTACYVIPWSPMKWNYSLNSFGVLQLESFKIDSADDCLLMQESGWNRDVILSMFFSEKKSQYFNNSQKFPKVVQILLTSHIQFLCILPLVCWRRNSLEGNSVSVTGQSLSECSCVFL